MPIDRIASVRSSSVVHCTTKDSIIIFALACLIWYQCNVLKVADKCLHLACHTILWYPPMWGFLYTGQSFCLCRCTQRWVGHSSLPLSHLVQATHPDSHGLLEHLHCWLMVILHHHTGRSARGLGSQLPAKHESNISVKQVQNIMSSSETCVWNIVELFPQS